MEKIRAYFETIVELSEEDWQLFSSNLIHEKLSKKTILLKKGQTEQFLSFIEAGLVRYYIPKAEYDLTFDFVFEDEFMGAYDSYITQTPCAYNVETLCDTILWRISYLDLQEIYAKTKSGNTIGRYESELLFLKKYERELSLLNETAEQRYLNLLEKQPRLIREIPLKYLASYIGITPQALSRIRKRIL